MRGAAILLVWAWCAAAPAAGKGAKSGPVFSAAAAAPATGGGSSGGGAHATGTTVGRTPYVDPRRAPPMEAERKVDVQDCTRPLDLTGGNLKCK